MDDPRSRPQADTPPAGYPAWLVILLVLLPLGGIGAAIAVLLIGPPDGASDDPAQQASYPTPPPVTFIVPTPAPTATPAPGLVGQPMPHISLTTLDGAPLHLPEDAAGEIVFLNFWATWCVPCRVEMPELQALHDARPEVRVMAVNVGEPRALIVDWVEHFGLTFEIVLDSEQAIASLYRLRGQPSTYIVSPNGVITSIFYGPTTRQTLEAALEPFLRG